MKYLKISLALILSLLLCASVIACKKEEPDAPPSGESESQSEQSGNNGDNGDNGDGGNSGDNGDSGDGENTPVISVNIPKTAGGKEYKSYYDAFNNTDMLYWDGVTEADAKAYGDTLVSDGYTLCATADNESLWFATYEKGETVAHIYYLKALGEFRAIESAGANLPAAGSEYEKICRAQITQLGVDEALPAEGMGYVIRLEDGTFVVIDGGSNGNRDASGIYDRLCELNGLTDAEELVIRAWFITHSDREHYGVLAQFIEKYDTAVRIEAVVANDCADEVYKELGAIPTGISYSSLGAFFGGCKFIKAHTGYKFSFPGLEMNILYTHEDTNEMQTSSLDSRINMVFDAVVGETRMLFLGDLETDGAARLEAMYGETLDCDILQISSGENSGSESLYRLCSPDTVLWTGSKTAADAVAAMPKNAYLTGNAKNIYFAHKGSKVIIFEEQASEEADANGATDENGIYSKEY